MYVFVAGIDYFPDLLSCKWDQNSGYIWVYLGWYTAIMKREIKGI